MANMQIYNYMQGPSEFTITGTLKTYDVTPLLKCITAPTLYTVGEFDEADPSTIRRFASLTPGATVEVIPDAAHITTWDNPDAMLRVVRQFLRKVDGRAGATPANR
jgi:proline iminopeptidase